MNRVQPTEKQPSMAIVSVIEGLIFIIFLTERTLSNIQIWVEVLHNIKIQKGYFLGLVAFSPEIQYWNVGQETNGKTTREIYIICEFYFVVICLLIDIALHGKSPAHLTDQLKYFPESTLIQNLSIGDEQANLNYLQGNVTQGSVYGSCPLKACH